MPWQVYILQCADRTLYTGITTDLERRLREHNLGSGARYTRARLPVKLLWAESQPDESTARKEEARIKRLSRRQKLLITQN